MNDDLKIGISQCLLGDNVRYNGGHSKDQFLVNTFGVYVYFIPVCPEVECGLSIPRESMRLVGDHLSPRLMTTKTGIDHTDRMQNWAKKRVQELENENLCGFIFKSKSPSSGMERIKVYNKKGMPEKKGIGMFARVFMEHFPLIPVEEEGRLNDPKLRENFIERIFTLKRFRDIQKTDMSARGLIKFHTTHKLLIMSHSQKNNSLLGKLVADQKKYDTHELFDKYINLLMPTLKLQATTKKHVNVLQHIMGYFKKQLSHDEKKELSDIISQYHNNLIPLIVPITILNHYIRKYSSEYLEQQIYLKPHPVELKLRNHV